MSIPEMFITDNSLSAHYRSQIQLKGALWDVGDEELPRLKPDSDFRARALTGNSSSSWLARISVLVTDVFYLASDKKNTSKK